MAVRLETVLETVVEHEWYYSDRNGQAGPFTLTEFREALAALPERNSVHVWRAGFSTWVHAEEVEDLNVHAPRPPPLPPPLPSRVKVKPTLLACPVCTKPVSSSACGCPHCGQLLSDEGESDPTLTEWQKVELKKAKEKKLGCGIMAVLAVTFVAWVMISAGNNTPEDRRARECSAQGGSGADIWARTYVAEKLRSPSTAKFVGRETTSWTGECNFSVKGMVDSQNGFGAVVRTRYLARMSFLPETNTWRMIDVAFSDQ